MCNYSTFDFICFKWIHVKRKQHLRTEVFKMARGSVPTGDVESFLLLINAQNVEDKILKRDVVRNLYKHFKKDRPAAGQFLFGKMMKTLKDLKEVQELGDYYIFGKDVQVMYERMASDSQFMKTLEEWKRIAEETPFFCEICGISCTSEKSLVEHQLGSRHRIHKLHIDIYRQRDKMTTVPEGMQLTCNPTAEEGKMELVCKSGEECTMSIDIENTLKDEDIVFQRHVFLWDTGVFKLHKASDRDGQRTWREFERRDLHIGKGETRYFQIKCIAPKDDFGYHFVPLALYFVKKDSKTRKIITAEDEGAWTQDYVLIFVSLHIISDFHEELAPKSVYEKPDHFQENSFEVTEPGEKLPEHSRNGLIGKLRPFHIPPHLYNNVRMGTAHKDGKITINSPYLSQILDCNTTQRNYMKKFHHLLWLEEIQMEIDIQQYNMAGVAMTICKNKMRLEVPGLAEKKPSVLRGDRLYVYYSDKLSERTGYPEDQLIVAVGNLGLNIECEADELRSRRNIRYEGIVHKIEREHVQLGVAEKLRRYWTPRQLYDVEFRISPFNMWVQHRAIEQAVDFMDLLFPVKPASRPDQSHISLRTWFDRTLNPEQQTAVRKIVQGSSRPAPYIIFGPPGTGKTVTVTEAIKQVYSGYQDSRILVCCPENSAADTLMRKLLKDKPIIKEDIFRMYALSRQPETLPAEIAVNLHDTGQYNYDQLKECFFFPSVNTLMEYRIIVVTLTTAGRMVTGKFPTNHFTHIFIDEGGHAVEPECIVPITGLMDPRDKSRRAQLVIAGDPKQLGPIVRSAIARNFGLPVSLMERMMSDIEMYKTQPFDERYITKLIRNYRSHDSILEIPRRMFYDNQLEACGDSKVLNCMLDWDMLPNKKFPVMFHSVFGTEEREGDSPSWFNRDEIAQIDMYLTALLKKKKETKVQPSDIGIIAPYKKQVSKIRQMLLAKRHIDNQNEITVGSVEEFQGQEFKIIIISAVRSDMTSAYTDIDMVFNLGFLRNPKRFNVAMTRARALLIVIGNPITLEQDSCWKTFIDYCDQNNAFRGQKGQKKSGPPDNGMDGGRGKNGDTSRKVSIPSLGRPQTEQKKIEQKKMSGKVHTRRKF
ncbi:putative helicase mov-10-B.1 isoform X12 [Dreissena polymorpha]|uniref:putative helicase mov-10-B.1 isoform X4 n=1 Tax=Dreissena polymorpha TaxID=45954 RepID=UPI002263BE63|nr:putative helicase mov-10-B.1 isoform X4 [Dreissena polymorpha]XP_052220004.1 putative helicase mov-10-B.1 isoform X8 [Dreissena polymorpha]XP_052220005.1 putative helicase mov-10-B.1 isoform X9 [Dreissena polymorpha]XP_052220006.1 putative helicase mov-10-B.1 isoform X10 [Dreissena polymorpha]XP_052220007.1 putative helicase mov-10-B.1 isoform X11 [Dreissena polymorpha]XP_052220008.1 putative helicase mov-10-B.1 isoform X12 [Dreissena polymorpha]